MIHNDILSYLRRGVTVWKLQIEIETKLSQKSTIWNQKESKIQMICGYCTWGVDPRAWDRVKP